MKPLSKMPKNLWDGLTKSFPRDDGFLAESKKFIDSTINKLNEKFNGTESYLKTLTRKNETFRFQAILDDQEKEAQKDIDTGNTMVRRVSNDDAVFRVTRNEKK